MKIDAVINNLKYGSPIMSSLPLSNTVKTD